MLLKSKQVHKYIGLGGRIVVLNLVLNSISIFYLSFLRMPVQVERRIVRIQREFLRGGVRGRKKISWVKWKVVCQQKRKGGSGVKDVRVVNVSLLTKWRWRLLDGKKKKSVVERSSRGKIRPGS